MAKTLKEKLGEIIPKLRNERAKLLKSHGGETISQVSVA